MRAVALVLALVLTASTHPPLTAAQAPQALSQGLGALRWGMSPAAVRGARPVPLDGSEPAFIHDELLHVPAEAVLEQRTAASRLYCFFLNGRLWKTFEAFDALSYPEGHFAGFAGLLQQRFGPAIERTSPRRWLEWRQAGTRLRALDPTNAYGFYTLIFEDLQRDQWSPNGKHFGLQQTRAKRRCVTLSARIHLCRAVQFMR